MPSAAIGAVSAVADTHGDPGIHGNITTECDPGCNAHCDTDRGTDGDTRIVGEPPCLGAAHGQLNT
jgi:hypothetical protein